MAMFAEYDMIQHGGLFEEELKEKYTKILLREVKIRVNLKWGAYSIIKYYS